MFGRVPFGRKKPPVEEPRRPAVPPQGQIFDASLFQGEMGDFLREHGFAPDDPRNQARNVQPLSVLLAEDQAAMRRAVEAVNGAAGYPLVPVHLLPVSLWHGSFGPWMRQVLDLSPYRPWNTTFLPGDGKGALALGLPIADPQWDDGAHLDMARALLSCIHDELAGRPAPEVEAMMITLRGVRANFPAALPPEKSDMSPGVAEARANVRAAAFLYATVSGKVPRDALLKSYDTFLGQPEDQLIA
jgi:hypothetical protein